MGIRNKEIWIEREQYISLVSKVQIKRSKKPVEFQQSVIQWILDHTRPSSNSKNIVKWKSKKDKVQHEHVVQWREEAISKMFQKCKIDINDGDGLKRSYFYHAIPEFVKKVKAMEGLCPYHMNARKWTMELARTCNKWHFPKNSVCKCTCVFCKLSGCAHGKKPLNGNAMIPLARGAKTSNVLWSGTKI